MKNLFFTITAACMLLCVGQVKAQLSTGVGGATAVGANTPTTNTYVGIRNTNPCFPLDVNGAASAMNFFNFDHCLRLKGSNTHRPFSSSLLFDGSNVTGTYNGNTYGVTKNLVIGGPGNTAGPGGSLGAYYIMLQDTAACPGQSTAATTITKICGNDVPNDPRMGSFQYFMDVLVDNSSHDGKVGIGTTTPERSLHVYNGSALITCAVPGNDGLLFKTNANTNLANWGDWGVQYGDLTSLGGKRGLNFWKPTGALYGTPNNNILFLADDNDVGIHTPNPSAVFHVNITGATSTTGIRFEGLLTSSNTSFLVVDGSGNVTKNSFTPLALSCGTASFLPRITSSTSMGCSIFADNGNGNGFVGFTSIPSSNNWTGGGVVVDGSPANPTAIKLDVNGMTRTTYLVVTSDQRLKKNIKPLQKAIDLVNGLRPVTYQWDKNSELTKGFGDNQQIGLLAQEVEKIIPEAVVKDENGMYAINYNAITPVLIQALKELNDQVKDVAAATDEIDALKNDNAQLKQQVTDMEKLINDICTSGCEKAYAAYHPMSEKSTSQLYQNTPNPFDQSTTIGYSIAAEAQSAKILVYDLKGQLLKSIEAPVSTNGSIKMSSGSLSAGTYTYTLVVDGKIIDTKLMVITKQ